MSGLTEDERRDLLRAWPWPQEAATTRDGFADVCAVVERIKGDAVQGFLSALWEEETGGVTDVMVDAALVEYRTSDHDGKALIRAMIRAALVAREPA